MSPAARNFLVLLLLYLVTGTLIGYVYDRPLQGLSIAALTSLAWQVRQLMLFDRASRSDKIDSLGYGDGIWYQVFSRFRFIRERANRRKARYQALLREVRRSTDAMPDGAIILDANNEIVTCNKAVTSLIGLKRKKDRGQRIDNILRDPQLAELLSNNKDAHSVEIPSPLNDGGWLNIRVAPYGAKQKLLMVRDVTDRKRLGKMRRDFVANASHELRSPLTVISGYLDAMSEDDDLPDQWQRPLKQMRKQSARMQNMLVELLLLSRVENAGSAPDDEAIDVQALLQEVCDATARDADSASVSVHASSSAKLLGKRAEIESLITNLLSNALRFTRSGGVIDLAWETSNDGACLSVTDDGEGIAAEHLSRLTERFYRVDRGRSRDDGGVGLGLAIVKHVMAHHDGKLEITSEPGSGSQFRCEFPATRLQNGPSDTVS